MTSLASDAALVDAIDRRFGGEGGPRRIGIAVSGGSDSLALLHLLSDWDKADELRAATVDHGLRPEATEEAARVTRVCEGFGIPHRILRWEGWDGRGNLQDHARRNRYGLLAAWGRQAGLQTICLGHTLDDQAETFLMRLSRESGVDGLSGMAAAFWRGGARFDRPLLFERREALRAYLSRRRVTWIDDPSNEDERFSRVRARRALAALEPLGIDAETIGMTMTNLELARMALAAEAERTARQIASEAGGDLIFDRARLVRLNPEIRRRLLAAALRWIASEDYPPRRDALNEVEAAIGAGRNTTLHGCLVMVTDMTVRITREWAAVRGTSAAVGEVWDGRWTIAGPERHGLEVRALGDALSDVDGWRATGLPRMSLVASPAVWEGETLVAAPLASASNGWTAETGGRDEFAAFLLSR